MRSFVLKKHSRQKVCLMERNISLIELKIENDRPSNCNNKNTTVRETNLISPSSPVYFLRTLILIGGFLLQVPFELLLNPTNNCYASHRSKFRRVEYNIRLIKPFGKKEVPDTWILDVVVISVLQVALTLQLLIVVYRGLSQNHTLTNVFVAIINLALLLWINVVITTLWTQKHVFANICTDLQHVCNALEHHGTKLPSKVHAVSLAVILCFGGLALTILEIIFLDLKAHKQELDIPSLLAHRVQYIFYGNTNVSYEPTTDGIPRCNSVWEMVIGIISLGVKFHYLNAGHYGYILMFSFCFLLGHIFGVLASCLENIENVEQYKVEQIIETFRDICALTRDINGAVGSIVSWGILAHLPYNAYKTKDLIVNDSAKQISYLIHTGIYAAVLMAGADANAKCFRGDTRYDGEVEVLSFNQYLTLTSAHYSYNINYFYIPAKAIVEKLASHELIFNDKAYHSKISILLHQTSNNRIGIRGGKLFVITYGFFGNILGIILTYSILIAQFQNVCK